MKTKHLLIVVMLAFAGVSFSQEAKYQLSSHILDVTQGKPAPGVKISLSKQDESGTWKTIYEKYTDESERIGDFLKFERK